jgi:uncharacterized membrane protein
MPEDRNKLTRQQRRQLERKGVLPKEPPSSSEQIIAHQQSYSWSGPLPPPSILQQYGFIKNGPERLFRLAEQQAKHRRKIENRDSWTEAYQRIMGSTAPLLVGLAGMAGGVFLIYSNNDVSGFITLIGTLAVLVAAVSGKAVQQKQRENEATAEAQRELFEEQ